MTHAVNEGRGPRHRGADAPGFQDPKESATDARYRPYPEQPHFAPPLAPRRPSQSHHWHPFQFLPPLVPTLCHPTTDCGPATTNTQPRAGFSCTTGWH